MAGLHFIQVSDTKGRKGDRVLKDKAQAPTVNGQHWPLKRPIVNHETITSILDLQNAQWLSFLHSFTHFVTG